MPLEKGEVAMLRTIKWAAENVDDYVLVGGDIYAEQRMDALKFALNGYTKEQILAHFRRKAEKEEDNRYLDLEGGVEYD